MVIYDINGNRLTGATKALVDAGNPVDLLPAMKRRFNDSEGQGTWNNYSDDNLFMIAHISDLHTDPVRYDNFMKFVSDNSAYINVGIETGDLVDTPNASQFSTMTAKETYGIDLLKTVGNHEKKYSSTTMTNANIYSNWNLTTNTGLTYYYKDYASHNLRIIVLNCYDTDSNSSDEHFTQAQIDWFITALQGAITNGYGVIVCRHGCEYFLPEENDSPFYQRWNQWESFFSNVCSGTPIEDIIDAFKKGSSIDQTYTYTDGVDSITVSASFASKGEFIAYLCGHHHVDMIGYSRKYSDQLYLLVTCGCCVSNTRDGKWSAVCDVPRKAGTVTEDAFNVYSIDRVNKYVKVLRIGSDVNDKLETRKSAVFEY